MSDRNNIVVVLVTAPDAQVAEAVGRKLVQDRLAACVNIVPGLRSLFWWEGEVQDAGEVLMLAKARGADVAAIGRTIRELHPYDCPEVIAVPITDGLQAYLDWITAETERE